MPKKYKIRFCHSSTDRFCQKLKCENINIWYCFFGARPNAADILMKNLFNLECESFDVKREMSHLKCVLNLNR